MLLTAPLMLLGLLAVPLLTAIYWFRNRSRRVVVSSLMLWLDQRKPRQGGRFLHRMQTPLAFFLELLAIALLAIAAAGPALVRKEAARPLVVVLDDSYSMLAHGPEAKSPRRQAEAALDAELAHDRYVARFLLAGTEARLSGRPVQTAEEAGGILAAWTCQSPWADLERALAVAAEVGGPSARILVLSDHAPPMKLSSGQVQWWAFGARLPNMALTAALRSASGEAERALVEVTNLSDRPGHASLRLEGGNFAPGKTIPIDLAPGAARQLFFDLPAAAPPLSATLSDDALEIDNKITLLPESTRPVRVVVDLADEALRQAVVRALEATGMALPVREKPDLIVCDRAALPEADAWRLEIFGGDSPASYTGPFVVDRTHALAQGLSLEGTIWSASPQTELSGSAVITAGNIVLVTDREDHSGRHRLQMNFAPGLSNLQDSPDWPILFANLLHWRRGALVGPANANVRLGQTVTVTLAEDIKQVELTPPAGPASKIKVRNRRVEVAADRIGLYAIKISGDAYQFSCNAVSRDESDLAGAESGQWGDWSGSAMHSDRQISLRWALLLAAMACLAGHLAVIGSGFRILSLDSGVKQAPIRPAENRRRDDRARPAELQTYIVPSSDDEIPEPRTPNPEPP